MPKTIFPEKYDCQINKHIKIGYREQSKERKVWYARFYWEEARSHYYYSLKIPFEDSKTSFKLAEEKARELHAKHNENIKKGGHYAADISVRTMSWKYLNEMKEKATENELLIKEGQPPKWRDNSKKGFWNLEKYTRRAKRHERIKDFFGSDWEQNIFQIDLRRLNSFKDWIKKNYNWSPSTINYHITELRQIWVYAYNNGHVDYIPTLDREAQDLAKRSRRFLTEEEWDLMINWAAERYRARLLRPEIQRESIDLAYQYYLWLHVVGYTGIRPPSGRVDKNLLRWKDYVIENKGKANETRTIFHAAKVEKPYEATIMPECWDIFDLLEEFRDLNELKPTYLFQHTHDNGTQWKKGDPIRSFKKSWETMLRELGLDMPKGTPQSKTLSPYCLRGYYITMRLRYGNMRITDLAKSLGTSQKMISEIYYTFESRKAYKSLTSGHVDERIIKRERKEGYAIL